MFIRFIASRIEAGPDISVTLTTREGAEFRIGGFASSDDAQSWITRETSPQGRRAGELSLVSVQSGLRDRAA